MHRTQICPKRDREYFPEEVQRLCPHCPDFSPVQRDPPLLPPSYPNRNPCATKLLHSLLVVLASSISVARAQVVNDGATNTLSNVTNTITGDVTVGTNGSFTLLVLSDNTLLTNSANGQLGLNATAKSNEVRLVSPTARWRMGTSLFVGNNGSSSRMVVSNGAYLENNGSVLAFTSTSSNNSALVTGAGTLWSNRGNLTVGYSGRGCQLLVSNGAWVASRFGYVSLAPGSRDCLVVVSGIGSVWSNQLDLEFAYKDRSNRMIIEAGGLVSCDNGRINSGGDLVFGTVPINNEVLVTGPGSLWTNRSAIELNNALVGGFSRLVVSNGAAVLAGGAGTVGGTGNRVVITGAGSRWANQSELTIGGADNQLEVSDGAAMVCSNATLGSFFAGADDTILLTGAGTVWSNRGYLTMGLSSGVRAALVARNGASAFTGGGAVLGSGAGANFNSALVTGPGTTWAIGNNVFVGSNGASSTLVVSNGARVLGAMNGIVGYNTSSSNNSVLVTGTNSSWSNFFNINVGSFGASNRMVVEKAGKAFSDAGYIGAFSSRNDAVVTDPGSAWTNVNELVIGDSGGGNRLVVSNGGVVQNTEGTIGLFSPVASNNFALVTGPGSLWNNLEDFYVGRFSSGNTLIVSNGGTVLASNVLVSASSVAFKNRLVVDGGTLRAVNTATNGRLDVQRGTNLFNAGLIEADNLILTNRGTNLPAFVTNGTISIPNGGIASPYPSTISVAGLAGVVTKVSVTLSNLSHDRSRNLDILLVSPAGQKVMLMSDAGSNGVNAVLNFDDAASSTLPDTTTIVSGTYRPTDFEPGETQPSPAPAGPYSVTLSSFNGSSPNGSWLLFIYSDSVTHDTGNIQGWSLQIATAGNPALDRGAFEFNGGTLISRGAIISNAATFVVGAGGTNPALWDVRAGTNSHLVNGDLVVGHHTAFNQLVLTNGALLTNFANSAYGILGQEFGANSNRATLAGAGSRWFLADGVFVGDFGSGNRLAISNGATLVTSSSSVIGNQFLSTNNEAVVTGPGSSWTSDVGQMFVGGGGRGNRLIVSDGGKVASFSGTIGDAFSDSSNNLALVTGAGSLWTNSSSLVLGDVGAANRLVVSNGGMLFSPGGGAIGSTISSGNNEAVITGPGSTWNCLSNNLLIGIKGSGNRLVITNGGQVVAPHLVIIGSDSSSINNRAVVDGGSLSVVESGSTGTLEVRRGTNVLNAGLIEADTLLRTNAQGFFEFNGGTLSVKNTDVVNGQVFRVGNGITPATLVLASNGFHTFGPAGVFVSSNSILSGNGTIAGKVVVEAGGMVSPGTSIGKLFLQSLMPVTLQGVIQMELSKNGSSLTNDVLQKSGLLAYGGSLVVNHLGPAALAQGDRFQLFIAGSYSGTFSPLTLPPLTPGLGWTNKLLVDGSIEVVSVNVPKISGLALSGTNLVFTITDGSPGGAFEVVTATNIVTPLMNWSLQSSGTFDLSGNADVTNGIVLSQPQRYFSIRIP